MKNKNTLLKITDFKRNLFDYLLISILGILVIVFSIYGGMISIEFSDLSDDENLLAIVLAIAAVVSSIRYTVNILAITHKKETADFAYSLPMSKSIYYLSKLLSVVIMVFITLCTIGVIGGLSMFINPFFMIKDIVLAILGAMATTILIIGAIFLSMSVTGKAGSTFLFFAAVVSFPMVFAFTSNMYEANAMRAGQINLITIPNLYTLTNALVLQLRGNIIYHGMFRAWIFTTCLGLAYAGLGLYMFRKRDAVTTGNYTINKWVNYICMAVIPFFIVYGAFRYIFNNIYRSAVYLQTPFVLGIAVGLFASALLITFLYSITVNGKFKRKNRCIWVYLVVVLISFVSNYAIFNSTYDANEENMDSEDISHISLVFTEDIFNYNIFYRRTYGGFMAEGIDIVDENIFNDISKYYMEYQGEGAANDYSVPLTKVYLNNGKIKYVTPNTLEMTDDYSSLKYYGDDLLSNYMMIPETNAVKNISLDNMRLDNNQIDYIYPTYLEEYNALNLEEKTYHNNKVSVHFDEKEEFNFFSTFDVFGQVGMYTTSDWLYITSEMPETIKKAIILFNDEYGDDTVKWINSDDMPEAFFGTLYENGKRVDGIEFDTDEEYNYIKNIINNYDMSAPDADDKMVMITYWNYTRLPFCYGRIYIELNDEEFETMVGFSK